MSIQPSQVADPRHRRGPVALQVADTTLDVPLLLRPAHQTEQGRERIVTDQGLITLVQPPLAAHEQLRRHRLGIVPPQLMGHAAEKAEGFDQAMQDGLGPLAGQGQGEGAIGVSPGRHQDRDQTPAVGEINVNVTEVALQPLAGIVVQRDEGLAFAHALGQEVEPDPLIRAAIAVFVAEAAKDFGGGMALFAWRLLIGLPDGVDEGLEGIEDRRQGPSLVGLGLGMGEDVADFASRVVKASCQLADAQVFLVIGLANAGILLHGDHPPPPVAGTAWLQ
jgi:hypothetical protein